DALTLVRTVLADKQCQGVERLRALRVASVALSELARYSEAKQLFTEAIALAAKQQDLDELYFNRNNLALTVLLPLGEFAAAADHLQAELNHFRDSPGLRLRSLTAWCDLCTVRGDWQELAQAIAEAEQLHAQMEVVESGDRFWLHFYRATLRTGQGRFAQAQAEIALGRDLMPES